MWKIIRSACCVVLASVWLLGVSSVDARESSPVSLLPAETVATLTRLSETNPYSVLVLLELLDGNGPVTDGSLRVSRLPTPEELSSAVALPRERRALVVAGMLRGNPYAPVSGAVHVHWWVSAEKPAAHLLTLHAQWSGVAGAPATHPALVEPPIVLRVSNKSLRVLEPAEAPGA